MLTQEEIYVKPKSVADRILTVLANVLYPVYHWQQERYWEHMERPRNAN